MSRRMFDVADHLWSDSFVVNSFVFESLISFHDPLFHSFC